MLFDMHIPQWIYSPATIDILTILSAFFLTYFTILGKTYYWCIDDLQGIASFSETWNDKEQKKIDSYELNGKQWKFLQFNPTIGFPGNIYRWLRLNLGKKFQVVGKNNKGHDVYGFKQEPFKHHIINLTVQAMNLVMAYIFLCNIMPHPIAFGAVLLYAVHPLTTASVAWISGYNYNFSMFFSLALLNVALTCQIPDLRYISVAVLAFLSTITIYTGGLTFVILWFLGLKVEAVIACVVSLIILFIKGKETKDFRIKAFKEQNMAATTFLNWRKPIVMMKTLWYYMRCVFLPIKIGLYHTWGYFYEEPIEHVDRMFWLGIAVLAAFLGLCFSEILPLQFGAIWFLTYLFIFSNFITAQQFVADRYAMVPSFGICIILSYFLHGTPFFWVLVGLYAMRTFLHLPTYKNEVDFYASNFLNFRKSEVALGNLGVAFINQGMQGAAVDTWILATKLNPHYDVPWYNLYSVFKGSGRLGEARDFLKKCLDAKIVHFDKKWTEELAELEKNIELQKHPVTPTEMFYHKAADHFKANDIQKEYQALQSFMKGDTAGLIPEMITQVKQRIAEIESSNNVQLHNSSTEPTRPKITGTHPVDSSAGVSAGSN